MTFKEFVLFNNINLDGVMVDKIFHNICNDMPIYMDESMTEYFGYSGTMKEQRRCLVRLINDNFTKYQNQLWYSYNNKEYVSFCEKTRSSLECDSKKLNQCNTSDQHIVYPPAPIGRGTSTTKHLLVMPKLLKVMLMLCQTTRGKRIRNYFIDIEEVTNLYIRYQCRFEKLVFEIEYKKMFSVPYTRLQSILEFDKNIQDKYRIGCVYYIQEEKTQNVKIGWCWYLPKRLNSLQVANSQKLTVIKYELLQFPYEREQELHIIYKDMHIRGEWFRDISDEIA